MTDSSVNVPNAGSAAVDTSQITQDGGTIIQRQRVVLGDSLAADALATIKNSNALRSDYGIITIESNSDIIKRYMELQYIQSLEDNSESSLNMRKGMK